MARRDLFKLLDFKSTRSRGKFAKVTIKATPIEIDLSDKHHKPTAEQILDYLKREIRTISEPAQPQTLERDRGQRISPKLFNRTGHLVRELDVVETSDGFAVVTPPDRLTQGQRYQLRRLAELIDMSPADILKAPNVRKSLSDSLRRMVSVGRKR